MAELAFDRLPGNQDNPQKLIGQTIRAVSVTSDDNGVSCIHLLGDDGHAFRIQPGDPGYLAIGEYRGWILRD